MRSRETFASVQRIGNWPALGAGNEDELEKMLRASLPAVALRGKAFEIMKEVSQSSRSEKTIGAQISAIIIPSHFKDEIHFCLSFEREYGSALQS
jgi:hypothetical protein